MAPVYCGDKFDHKHGVIHSAGFPAGDDNTHECSWQLDNGNNSKICYDISFYSNTEKMWSKYVRTYDESNSERPG